MRSRWERAGGLLASAGLWLALVGCGPGGKLDTRLQPHVAIPQEKVVVFLVDGLDPAVVRDGIAAGRLPNIAEHFVRRGLWVDHAITTVPSVTYAAITAMLTGYFPYQHGVIGIYWFEPAARRFRNYETIRHYRVVNEDFAVPTVYEHLRPRISVSVQNAIMRGVTRNFANWASSGVRWLFKAYTSVDKLTASTWPEIVADANARGSWPALALLYFPGVDAVGHQHGPASAEYVSAVEHADYQIGRVLDWLAERGLLAETHVVLVSDHGMLATEPAQRIDLPAVLAKQGIVVTDRPLQDGAQEGRARFYDQFAGVVVYHTGRRAALYLQGVDGWDVKPEPAAVGERFAATMETLTAGPGFDLVAYRDDEDGVALRTAHGRARVVQRTNEAGEQQFRYDPEPDDALGYLDSEARRAFVAGGFHSAERWLAMTAASDYPDVVPQLGPLLAHPRGGDVLLFAAPGWCFTPQRGGHGGVRAGEMTATFAIAGPQFPPGTRLGYARTLDLAATILDLLGAPLPADWPSRSLRQRLREQEPRRSIRDPFAVENWLTAGLRPR